MAASRPIETERRTQLSDSDLSALDYIQPNLVRNRTGVEYAALQPQLAARTQEWITSPDWDTIKSEVTNPAKMTALCEIIRRKLPSLEPLVDALRETGGYTQIAEQLESKIQTTHVVKVDEKFKVAGQILKGAQETRCESMRQHWRRLFPETHADDFIMENMYGELEIRNEGTRYKHLIKKGVEGFKEMFAFNEDEMEEMPTSNVKKPHETSHVRIPKNRSKIVLEGDPGMGKSTFLNKMALQWSTDKPKVMGWTEGHMWLNDKFALMILIELGSVKPTDTLDDCLKPLLGHPYMDAVKRFFSDQNNHPKILLVLDAFDEMPHNKYFNNLIEKKILGKDPAPTLNLIVSSRISHSRSTVLLNNASLVLRSVGFSIETVKEKFQTKISNLDALTQQHNQEELYQNPLLVGMAAEVGQIYDELFDLIDEFCYMVCERHIKKHDKMQKSLNHTLEIQMTYVKTLKEH